MDPKTLLENVSGLLWHLADEAVRSLSDPLAGLTRLTGEHPALQDKLLEPLAALPDRSALLALLRDVFGDVTDAGSPVRAHGWQHDAKSARGLALVLTDGASRAVVAVSPGPNDSGPTIDVVVTPGAALQQTVSNGPWEVTAEIRTAQDAWVAAFFPGAAPVPPAGTARITARRGPFGIGPADGPHISMDALTVSLAASPTAPVGVDLLVEGFQAAVLPPALASFLSDGGGATTGKTAFTVRLSRTDGLRFKDGGARLALPVGLDLPGVSTRGFALELDEDKDGIVLRPTFAATAKPPVLPLNAAIDGLGLHVPVRLRSDRIGVDPTQLQADFPAGMGIELCAGPVSGGGSVLQSGAPGDGAYAGALDADLGFAHVQAFGLLQLPVGGRPLSFLVLLGAEFGYPGIQLSFGFALDAVGGLVGFNRRVDDEHLRALVLDGNADRILFPGDAVARAHEIAGSLEACFPVARSRFVVGPMVRITWGGRILALSAAVVLDLPEPVRALLLGRLTISLPDPLAPLIRLQADVFGKVDPGVPEVEVLAGLTGSWIVGLPVSGDFYLLFRGGGEAVFVLSAGGFHPRFVRPPGVPALRRLAMDLSGGVLRLRAEAYLALTSNSLQFGAKLSLDATIAGCGVEGSLGLDALFVWEPSLAFTVHVYASVAVLAFGRRLAAVGLDLTLEGPAPWHAFGTGSISVLFWDVSLDFDERWGAPPAVAPKADEVLPLLRDALARPDAWAAERPPAERSPLRFTDQANTALAKGEVAYPDATFRASQKVVPLDTAITRFHRVHVPEQTWRIVPVLRATDAPLPTFGRTTGQFVPGEVFELTDDQQLTRQGFEELPSGALLSDADVRLGARHPVNDNYETGYKVEADWFTGPPPPDRRRLPGTGLFELEGFARPVRAAERVDRWRAAQRPVDALKVELLR
ncbi:hypothetical protein J5Y04_37195 [Kitasatospora sp. RG8]|uniref:DUF6603 domain-containing protein n=1 Tax=Kitasatospora sp. RG8 TaxID=2820815 RepID=UPI001ADF215D|nr:DUF6603 domain-containing protein [Kitasatospora sp. RG8]MBP0455113.1 hypothetical protein [Kitasatospora sp. RG8]